MAQAQVTQSKLIVYLIILLGAIGGYVYYSQVGSAGAEVPPPPKSELDAFKELKLDFAVLNEDRYKALKVFGEQPVNPGVTGKQDLFTAF